VLVFAPGLRAGPHAVVGEATAASDGSELLFPLPVALPPDGGYRVMIDGTGQGIAVIAAGAMRLRDVQAAGPTRVAFVERVPPPDDR
jgi:hypothetical protein